MSCVWCEDKLSNLSFLNEQIIVLRKALVALTALLLCKSVLAVDYFGVENTIRGNVVDVQINVLADEIEFKVFGEVANLTSNADCRVQEGLISCRRLNASINLRFQSSSLVEASGGTYKFSQQFLLPSARRVTSLVTLPVGNVIANVSDAVYPKKYSMLSNGRNILVFWELENVSSLQPVAFQVYYQPLEVERKEGYSSYIFLIIVALVLVAALIGFRKRRVKTEVKPEKVVLKVLDAYERRVFEIVKKAGKVKQGKIVEATGLSKAKVSRVVKSLEEKGLLKTERRGRTKLVMLKGKMFR